MRYLICLNIDYGVEKDVGTRALSFIWIADIVVPRPDFKIDSE